MMSKDNFNPINLFSMYMEVVGVPILAELPCDDPALRGKKLGIVNGASCDSLPLTESNPDCQSQPQAVGRETFLFSFPA